LTPEEEQELRQRVWGGAVPIFIQLAQNEITTVGDAPQPLLLLVPRVGYLSLLADTVREHFASFAPTVDGRLWFEYEGNPVRWHYPAGALYDAAGPQGPWQLTAHFLSFPEEELLACQDENAVKMVFFQAAKEAMYMKHGNASSFMQLAIESQDEMWNSMVTLGKARNIGSAGDMDVVASLDSYSSIENIINTTPLSELTVLPLRAHRMDLGGRTMLKGVQKRAEGATSLADALEQLNPSPGPECTVIIQGIEIERTTDLEWIYAYLRMPDDLLHIVVRAGTA